MTNYEIKVFWQKETRWNRSWKTLIHFKFVVLKVENAFSTNRSWAKQERNQKISISHRTINSRNNLPSTKSMFELGCWTCRLRNSCYHNEDCFCQVAFKGILLILSVRRKILKKIAQQEASSKRKTKRTSSSQASSSLRAIISFKIKFRLYLSSHSFLFSLKRAKSKFFVCKHLIRLNTNGIRFNLI